jgi:hypothetical protein
MKTEKAAAAKRKAHSLPFPIVRPHSGARQKQTAREVIAGRLEFSTG